MIRKILITLSFVSLLCSLHGQGDTTIRIETIEISDDLRSSSNNKPTKSDFSGLSNTLSDHLSRSSNVYIKNYGFGTLATSSIRGGNAAHTLVLWNGLPIQSPMLGLLDLSLINTGSTDEITVTKGGNSSMWGSGAVSGVVNLRNKITKNDNHILNKTSYGSFGRFDHLSSAYFKNGKWKLKSSVEYIYGQNDFPFSLGNGTINKVQTNAELRQWHVNQDVYFQADKKNLFSFHYWMIDSERQIPPTTTQNISEAYQEDVSNRLMFSWKHLEKNSALNVKAGYFAESLDYFDPRSSIESLSDFETYTADVTWDKLMYKNHRILVGASNFYTSVESPSNYNDVKDENRLAFLAKYAYTNQRFETHWSIRREYVDGKAVPVVPAMHITYSLLKHIELNAAVHRNYRLPTFNDRFWSPGGNPDLLAESGWSQEIGVNYISSRSGIRGEVQFYNRNISDWILWSRGEGQFFLSPINLAEVWSRGVEFSIHGEIDRQQSLFKYGFSYNLVKSTNRVAVAFPQIQEGDQLPYTPEHYANGYVSFLYRSIHCGLSVNYQSSSIGINEDLDAFAVADAFIEYQPSFLSENSKLRFGMNNLWNSSYRVVDRRPMPGRNLELTFTYIIE